ncbi:MAG: hypothetical protein LDL11_03470 [Desulfarculus sp.]|nr:hypothetical protein [Desulfarculus sp.]
MSLSALLFPQTVARRSALVSLAGLFNPVLVLEPWGPDRPAADSPLQRAGWLRVLRPATDSEGYGQTAQQADALLRQWEAWAAQNRGSGLADFVKAGMMPPQPDPDEAVGDILRDLRTGRPSPLKPPSAPLPQLSGDLLLRLAQRQDQETAEMEELAAKVEAGQDRLGKVLGLDQEDSPPADYDQPFDRKLPPLDYDQTDQVLWERRLRAWSQLAARIDTGEALLASACLPAVAILLERANRRLRPAVSDLRSPAGSSAPLPELGAGLPPNPDSPQAQEAFRLVLPDFAGLDDQRLLALAHDLEARGLLSQMRQALANLLARLRTEVWSAALAGELSAAARQLAESLAGHVQELGHDLPLSRHLSLLAFPGLSRTQVLGLMASADDSALPPADDWPRGWPAGSCPLVAVW